MGVRSVQFVSSEAVIGAYEARKCPAWAIWQDKQFLFKYQGNDLEEGSADLKTCLEWLQESAAIYTIRVYEAIDGDRITDKSAYDGSFNFRFEDVPIRGRNHSVGVVSRHDSDLAAEIREMRKEFAELKAGEPGESKLGVIGELLDHPALEGVLPILAEGLVGLITKSSAAPKAATHMISGVDDNDRIVAALNILDKSPAVEDLAALLEKLAAMSEKKPTQFKMYINLFMKMKV